MSQSDGDVIQFKLHPTDPVVYVQGLAITMSIGKYRSWDDAPPVERRRKIAVLIAASSKLRSVCESALESIEMAQQLLKPNDMALSVFDGAFLGVKEELQSALALANGESQ